MYTVNLRMDNPGPAKYLLEAVDANTFGEAFCRMIELDRKREAGQFVEIVTADGQQVARLGFKEKSESCDR